MTTKDVIRVMFCEKDSINRCTFRIWREGPCAKKYRQLLEPGKRKEVDSPLEPREGTQPCGCLGFSSGRRLRTSDFQNCVIINPCSFRPVNVW